MADRENTVRGECDDLRAELSALEHRRDALRNEAALYRSIYDGAPDMSASCEVGEMTILACNTRFAQQLGYPREWLLGRSILSIIHPDDRARYTAETGIAAATREALTDYRTRCVRSDGTAIVVSLYGSTRCNELGEVLYTRGIARDCTALGLAETSLKANEQRLRVLTETLDVIPWQAVKLARKRDATNLPRDGSEADWYHDYKLEYVGPQVERILGFTRARWQEPGFWFGRVHPEDRRRLGREIAERMLGSARTFRTEYRIQAADGRWVWGLNLSDLPRDPLPDPRGSISITGVFADITGRKEREQAQRDLVRELDHRVGNTFATITAILDQALATTGSVEDCLERFRGRTAALAAIHTMIADCGSTDLDLHRIVDTSLSPFREGGHVCIDGPEVALPQQTARAISMILHELATNAVKYGALSKRSGRVSVVWNLFFAGANPQLALQWAESGGPAVRSPSRRGYGIAFIEGVVPHELGGVVSLSFAASGVVCALEIPLGDTPGGGRGE